MPRFTGTSLALGAFVIALAGPAAAFGPGSDARKPAPVMLPGFEALDSTGSGSVTLEEFQARLQTGAARQEAVIAGLMQHADESGRLDEDALRAGFDTMRQARQDQTRAQRGTMGARLFARIDVNEDGVIDAEEYEAFTTRMAERMERRDGRSAPRGPRWGRDPWR